jgi:hypothetical protein
MAIRSYKDLVDAELNGQTFIGGFRKTFSATATSSWFDITLSPGNPLPFYYATSALSGMTLSQSVNGGIVHNQPVASLGYKTYLKTLTITPSAAAFASGPMILMDYLYYYPFIDTSSTNEQFLGQGDALPRYTTGKGVQVMAVQMAGLLGSGSPTFRFTYTNQNNVSRTSPTQTCGSANLAGQLATGNTGSIATPDSNYPFLRLCPGDTGVRSIQSITFDAADIGLLALVLVKPLEQIILRENTTGERTPVTDFLDLPVIEDDAYLSMLINPGFYQLNQSSFIGTIQTIWG